MKTRLRQGCERQAIKATPARSPSVYRRLARLGNHEGMKQHEAPDRNPPSLSLANKTYKTN
jgi:hypothetical protein